MLAFFFFCFCVFLLMRFMFVKIDLTWLETKQYIFATYDEEKKGTQQQQKNLVFNSFYDLSQLCIYDERFSFRFMIDRIIFNEIPGINIDLELFFCCCCCLLRVCLTNRFFLFEDKLNERKIPLNRFLNECGNKY